MWNQKLLWQYQKKKFGMTASSFTTVFGKWSNGSIVFMFSVSHSGFSAFNRTTLPHKAVILTSSYPVAEHLVVCLSMCRLTELLLQVIRICPICSDLVLDLVADRTMTMAPSHPPCVCESAANVPWLPSLCERTLRWRGGQKGKGKEDSEEGVHLMKVMGDRERERGGGYYME